MIARLAGVALDARVAARSRDPRQRALAAQWIAANVLGVSRIRAEIGGAIPDRACVMSFHARTLRAFLATLASVPVLIDAKTVPLRWRAVLRVFGIPVLDRPVVHALASGASVAKLA